MDKNVGPDDLLLNSTKTLMEEIIPKYQISVLYSLSQKTEEDGILSISSDEVIMT